MWKPEDYIVAALAILIMLTYPISEPRAYEIRAELESRRGKPEPV